MMALAVEEVGVLDQIVMAKRAWVPLANLALDVVDHLQSLGLVVKWCRDALGQPFLDGPLVTLTPFGAMVRHVTLMERVEGYPRWVDVKRAERRERRHTPIRARSWVGVRLMSFPELVAAQDEREAYMVDEIGRRVYLFDGIPVKIDPRLTRCKRHAAHH